MAFTCLQDDAGGTSGSLELIRHSCQASYCTHECTCAAAGHVCIGSSPPCVQLNSSDPGLSSVRVLPVIGSPPPQSSNSPRSAHS
ncbi:uncharacterized protein LOC143288578 [Babylonia areolata]|uniref:uncharacterized protein LOC143288578 n=1 Tax=Babylonia areolata TaxID=304850 RepID=UPI003FD26DD6